MTPMRCTHLHRSFLLTVHLPLLCLSFLAALSPSASPLSGVTADVPVVVFTAGLRYAFDVKLDSSANLYIVDRDNHRVVKLSPDGAFMQNFTTTSPSLYNPISIALDSSDFLYIADAGNARVIKVSPKGELVQSFDRTQEPLKNPHGVTVDSAGQVFIVDFATPVGKVYKMAPDGTQLDLFNTTDPPLYGPSFIALDSHSNIWLASQIRNTWRLSPNGTQLAHYNQSTYTVSIPGGLAVDRSDCLYISDRGSSPNRVVKLSPAGKELMNFTTTPQLRSPDGLTVDGEGNVYVADFSNHRVMKFLNSTQHTSSASSSSSSSATPFFTSSSSFSDDASDSSSSSTGLIAGVAVIAVLALCVTFAILAFLLRRWRKASAGGEKMQEALLDSAVHMR